MGQKVIIIGFGEYLGYRLHPEPSHHFLQTFCSLRMFKIVFRDSSLYPKQLSLFCLLWLISACSDRIGYITEFSNIRSCKPGCASGRPVAHFLCSTARIRQDIREASCFSCKLLWRIDECVLLPCFKAQLDMFVVMNCCVVPFSLFSSDILTWTANSYIQCNDT